MARLETAVGFVDHIYSALAADYSAIAMAVFCRFQRITYFHGHTGDLYGVNTLNRAKRSAEHTVSR